MLDGFCAFGFQPLAANVTNSVAQWPGYVGVVAGNRQDLPGQRRRLVLTGAVAVVGSAIGCVLLLVLPGSVFDAVVPVLVYPDVRAAVGNYRDVTLAGELATGREVLRAAGIVADFPRALDAVDPSHQELFGWVVREGVTNIVRHAHASSCAVRLSESTVTIASRSTS